MKLSNKNFASLTVEFPNYVADLLTIHDDFGGPSIYFHQQALIECEKDFLSLRHLEMIYATLAAWGMHRMGKTKTKMLDFETFKSSIINLKDELTKLKKLRIEDYQSEPTELLQALQDLCFSIRVSISNSKIVGNSKALAHILPNLVPPVDRQYSIRFFAERLANFKGIDEEKEFYLHILKRCYEFSRLLKENSGITVDKRFNSSIPKISDNMLMIHLKKQRTARNIGIYKMPG